MQLLTLEQIRALEHAQRLIGSVYVAMSAPEFLGSLISFDHVDTAQAINSALSVAYTRIGDALEGVNL